MKNVLLLLLLALALWSCQEAAPTQAEPELTLEAQAVSEPRVFASKEAFARERFLVVFKSDGRAVPEQAAAVLARVAARMPSEMPQTLHLYQKVFRAWP